jgi:6-phosphogluconolactonase
MDRSSRVVASNPQDLALQTALWIGQRIAASSKPFRLVLTGGTTPLPLFDALVAQDIAWRDVEFFWTDERVVPWDDPASNYGSAYRHLLSRLALTKDHIHPMATNGGAADGATRYEAMLQRIYGATVLDPAWPLFDLVLLGLGEDGHIASLFPKNPVLDERERWVAPVFGQPQQRITLTYPALESSAHVAFYVTGAQKRDAVRTVLSGDTALPAARLHPHGQTLWFLDSAAAGA